MINYLFCGLVKMAIKDMKMGETANSLGIVVEMLYVFGERVRKVTCKVN